MNKKIKRSQLTGELNSWNYRTTCVLFWPFITPWVVNLRLLVLNLFEMGLDNNSLFKFNGMNETTQNIRTQFYTSNCLRCLDSPIFYFLQVVFDRHFFLYFVPFDHVI